MEETPLLPAVVEILLKNLSLTINSRGNIAYGGRGIAVDANYAGRLLDFLPKKVQREVIVMLDPEAFSDAAFSVQLDKALKERLKPPPKEGYSPAELVFMEVMTCPLSDLILCLDYMDVDAAILYSPHKDLQHPVNRKFALERLSQLLGDEFGLWSVTNVKIVTKEYHPLKPRLIIDREKERTILNTWSDAEWKKGWTPSKDTALPPEVEEYFTHFFATAESRKHTEAWLRDAVFSRAEPILIFSGSPGAGKNTFVNMGKQLVGKENYNSAARGFARSAFHSSILDRRIFLFDEMSLDPEMREHLKSYHNGEAAVERKGKDVQGVSKIHASFIIANNHESEIKLQYRDRKFFYPELTSESLEDLWGRQKAEHFNEVLLQDPAYLRRIASYLYYEYEDQQSRIFPKTQKFRQCCINSYPQYFQKFLEQCKTQPEISSREFNRGDRHPPGGLTLREKIKDYEYQFKEKLAEIDIETSGNWTAKSYMYQALNGSGEKRLPTNQLLI